MKNYSLKTFVKKIKNRTLKVEDCCEITKGDNTFTVVCIGTWHDELAVMGPDTQRLAGYTFNVYETVSRHVINDDLTNKGGWQASDMRRWLRSCEELLPEELRELIVPVVKYTSAGSRKSNIVDTEDRLFLFSEVEVFGTHDLSFEGEGKQYEFFKEWRNRFKHSIDYKDWSSNWWLRSPHCNNATSFVYVYVNGYAYSTSAYTTYGVSFGFCTL